MSTRSNPMSGDDLTRYYENLKDKLRLESYVPRSFTVSENSSTVSEEMQYRFRGRFRDKEVKLPELLERREVLILAEPGGGKSVVARAAVHHLMDANQGFPIFLELKEYRGDLANMVAKAVPDGLLDGGNSADKKGVRRRYILDGVDEIPQEHLEKFGRDLSALLSSTTDDTLFLTARQAFFVAHEKMLPEISNVFHILEFSDEDIDAYLAQIEVDSDAFLSAIYEVDAKEEIRNPFVLFVMSEQFRQTGRLSELRSDNINYMIERLLQNRPRFNQHRQRRALLMIAVAMEAYARNELTETEALAVIKKGMEIPDQEAAELLNELYNSILKRTTNGLAFQMRSYGEYLAAQARQQGLRQRASALGTLADTC